MDHEQWIASLVERHERALCRYAYGLTASVSQARDAVQETFLRLCKVSRGKIEGHETAWLFKVCRSRVLDCKRKERPVQALTSLEEQSIPAADASPSETAMRLDDEDCIPRLMEQLPKRQCEAIRLKFQQELRYREIAEVMNLSESHVGVLIHKGVKALRRQMLKLQGELQ